MQRLNFFPAPYPDECYYSIFCRYHVRNGSLSHVQTIWELFGNAQCLASLVLLPRRLELVDQWFDKGCGITRRDLAVNYSAYPYISTFLTESMFENMKEGIKSGKADHRLELKAIQKCRRLWKESLCYCPECACEDIKNFGEAYWHRLPQLRGVEYCLKHEIQIQKSSAVIKGNTMKFLPASVFQSVREYALDPDKERYKEKYLRIAKDTKWLLENGLKLKGAKAIATKYKQLFMERGITTAQGIIHYERLKSEFIGYHGEEFLEQLFPDGEEPLYWIRFVFVSMSEKIRPLHHVLLMQYLKGSAKDFYLTVPDNEPYGWGPWPCINKICPEYGMGGAEKVSVTYINGQTIGRFQCLHCGMKYQRSSPEQKFEHYSRHAVVLDYGELWYEKLRECAEVKKLTLKDIMSEMQCTAFLVKRRAMERGIRIYGDKKSYGMPEDTMAFYTRRSVNREHKGQYFKEKVEEVLADQGELTAKELSVLVPGAYRWFQRNDFQWLKDRLMIDQEKRYWSEWEQEQLGRLKSAYEVIRQTGDPNRRITLGWICTTAGTEEHKIKNRLHRFSEINTFVKESVESKEKWLSRRIAEIAKKEEEKGKKLKLSDIKREMGIKPNTYKKHGAFIAELIEKLNK